MRRSSESERGCCDACVGCVVRARSESRALRMMLSRNIFGFFDLHSPKESVGWSNGSGGCEEEVCGFG